MKKWFAFLVLFILFSSFIVLADDPPSGGINESDKKKVDKIVENIPINEDGSFNSSLLNPLKSKAEKRIDAINKWFVDNAPWLSLIFGIVPAISWLFAANFYFMLLFATIVLNFTITKWKIGGWIVYIVLLVTKFYVVLARGVLDLIEKLWLTAIILAIIVIIGLILLLIFAPQLLIKIGMLFQKDKMRQVLEKAEVNERVLAAKVEGMEKGVSN